MFSLPKTCFGLLTTKLVALKFRSQKTAFFVSKTRCTQLYSTKNMFWSVCRKIVLFPAFYLILDKLHCFRILFPRTTFSFVFVTKLHFWCSILPKKCSGLLATKLGWFEPHVAKNSVFPFLCLKYPAFSLIQEKYVLVCLPLNWDVTSIIAPKEGFLPVCKGLC